MPYTRRDLLRDAALISATGVVAGSPFILGCHTKPTPPPPFSGVRVFFSGAWIFCRAPDDSMYSKGIAPPQRMYAIARDMEMPNMQHTFPYGIWTDSGFDNQMPSLPAGHYKATVDKVTPGASICAMFHSAACGRGPFRYFANSRNEIKLDTLPKPNQPDLLRIISLPVPTRILPAAYLTQADFVPTDPQSSILSDPPSGASYSVKGLPTTHILEYENATYLNFDGVQGQIQATPGRNFHVHTIPPVPTEAVQCTDHGPTMFSNLLQILYRPKLHKDAHGNLIESKEYLCECDLQLVNSDPSQLEPGPNVPDGITDAELEIFTPQPVPVCNTQPTGILSNVYPFNYHLASCSGSGFGVDGDVTG
jgi:hypothetical protein